MKEIKIGDYISFGEGYTIIGGFVQNIDRDYIEIEKYSFDHFTRNFEPIKFKISHTLLETLYIKEDLFIISFDKLFDDILDFL